MTPRQVRPRRRHQCRKTSDEVKGLEPNVRRSVSIGVPQSVADLPLRSQIEPIHRVGRHIIERTVGAKLEIAALGIAGQDTLPFERSDDALRHALDQRR